MNLRAFLEAKMRIEFLFLGSFSNVMRNLTASATTTFDLYSLSSQIHKEYLREKAKNASREAANGGVSDEIGDRPGNAQR